MGEGRLSREAIATQVVCTVTSRADSNISNQLLLTQATNLFAGAFRFADAFIAKRDEA